MAAFLEYAVKHLTSSSDAKLDQYPKAHHPLIAKLVHESCVLLSPSLRLLPAALARAAC